MNNRNRLILSIAGILCLLITVMEVLFPLNVVGAYGFVLPILLVATVRNRKLMYLTVLLCVVVSCAGLFQPTKKKERFTTVVINRTMVVCVLIGVAYIGMTWEERKAREEAARSALARASRIGPISGISSWPISSSRRSAISSGVQRPSVVIDRTSCGWFHTAIREPTAV